MLILLRVIAQRSFIYGLSFLTFLGINPDVTVPDTLQSESIKESQLELMRQALEKNPQKVGNTVPEFTENVEQKIIQAQRTVTQNIADPLQEYADSALSLEQNIEEIDFEITDVAVHILCIEKTNSYTRLSSGSGVIVSNTGIVLTNAHVAYPFLFSSQFEEDKYTCAVRKGDNSQALYTAELVYYPLDWLLENQEIITEPSPVGTGENDYAFLALSGTETAEIASESFKYPFLETNEPSLRKDTTIRVAGYPGVHTGVLRVDSIPDLIIADTYVADIFTFSSQSADVIQTGTTDVARRGSSGGGVFDLNKLLGIVVTTGATSEGSYINAITLPYIKDDFETDTGFDFEDFLNSSPETLQFQFDFLYKEALESILSQNSE